jgi:hypothetical protein
MPVLATEQLLLLVSATLSAGDRIDETEIINILRILCCSI